MSSSSRARRRCFEPPGTVQERLFLNGGIGSEDRDAYGKNGTLSAIARACYQGFDSAVSLYLTRDEQIVGSVGPTLPIPTADHPDGVTHVRIRELDAREIFDFQSLRDRVYRIDSPLAIAGQTSMLMTRLHTREEDGVTDPVRVARSLEAAFGLFYRGPGLWLAVEDPELYRMLLRSSGEEGGHSAGCLPRLRLGWVADSDEDQPPSDCPSPSFVLHAPGAGNGAEVAGRSHVLWAPTYTPARAQKLIDQSGAVAAVPMSVGVDQAWMLSEDEEAPVSA